MKISTSNINTLKDILQFLPTALSQLDTENFKVYSLSGTTDSVANTKKLFFHGLKKTPSAYLPVEGNIYVYSRGSQYIDIRSTQTSTSFKILLLG